MTAEQGAASLAALNLFRTQSAITRSIRDLEHTLAISLFERHAKGMLLTDFGQRYSPTSSFCHGGVDSDPGTVASVTTTRR